MFTLQNKGIPVNELYEKEGIKDIPTARFGEIMGEEKTGQSSCMYSFYTDDSYEPILEGPDPVLQSKEPKVKPANVPILDLINMP